MVFNRGSVALLLIAWAFYLSVGSVGLTVPFLLMIVGTILYLF